MPRDLLAQPPRDLLPVKEHRVRSGAILPYRVMADEEGKERTVWDPMNEGITGSLRRVFALPGEVFRGEVQSTDEMIGRTTEAAEWLTPMAPAARGARLLGNVARRPRPAPDIPELKQAAKTAYEATRKVGVDFSVPHVNRMAGDVSVKLNNQGLSTRRVPKTHEILSELQKPGKFAPLQELDNARQELRAIQKEAVNPVTGEALPESAAAQQAINALDDFIEKTPKGGVLSGDIKGARTLQKEARANTAAAKRSKTLQVMQESATIKSEGAYSGRNYDNTLRQELRWILNPRHPERLAGFSDAEKARIREINKGTPGMNRARYAANWLGGGGGLGQYLTAGGFGGLGAKVGFLFGGPWGAAIGGAAGAAAGTGVGSGLKSLENTLAKRAFLKTDEMLRSRSPLAKRMRVTTPSGPPLPVEERSLLVKALLAKEGEFPSRENKAKRALIEGLLNGT